MDRSNVKSRLKARASTGIDASGQGPVLSINWRGFPSQGRRRDVSKRVQRKNEPRANAVSKKIRIASLNIGTLTGKAEELAEMLRRRRIDICSLQETRWSGAKAYDMERQRGSNGYKLLYFGSTRTRYGVGIAVSEHFRDAIKEVNRYDDRLMKITIVTADRVVHVFSAYAPQTGRSEAEKDAFWAMLDCKVRDLPIDDYIVIAGDLNGHVGKDAGGNRCHGGKGYGQLDEDGERIADFANSNDLVVANTWFIKRPTQLLTYYSGDSKSQIDFILVRRRHLCTVTNVNAVAYETVAPQHRPVIATLRIGTNQHSRSERTGPPRIKWWRFKEREAEVISRMQLPPLTTVEETWNQVKQVVHEVARKTVGITKAGKRFVERNPWIWTEEVKRKVREKKKLYHVFLGNKTQYNWEQYRRAKRDAKKSVAVARATHYAEIFEKLDTRDGERDLFRLAKRRHQQTQDIEKFYCVNDEHGKLIVKRKAVLERWRQYFESISTQEFPHPPLPQALPTSGPVPPISVQEVKEAIIQMKAGKATGPDDIAAEMWKAKSWDPSLWLASFFNKMLEEQRVPTDWQSSTTVPIWKKKGSPAECSNYRPVRLLCHTMKIFERIIDRRIRDIVSITANQAGFVKGCGTIDAIHVARLLLEKYREKQRALHVAFLDLEKAFDRVPHELIWYSLREHQVPEELVRWVKLLYSSPQSQVRTAAGTSKRLRISVGVHQGSALSPLLFVVVMDTVTRDIQRQVPYTLLYADDVFLASENKSDLEQLVQVWSDRLAQRGLRLNLMKTEYLTTDPNESGTLTVNGIELPRTDNFKYLGSTLSADGNLQHEVSVRISATWMKWQATTGVLCDRRMKDNLKSKVYRTVVRAVALYGAECWPVTKSIERRFAVMETKMLRWISGITRYDHVSNNEIRKRYGVAPIVEKMREARLRWYGHTLRADESSLAKAGLKIDVVGRRPKGRPRQRWIDTLNCDLSKAGLHPDQAYDREKWRTRSRIADPATKRE